MNYEVDHQAWLEKFQLLLKHYLPPVENTPTVTLGGLAIVAAGLLLVFRSGKFERTVVCAFGLLLGGWIGSQISQLTGTPGPITAAVGALIFSIIAYRTYKLWLAGGSVIVLFSLAIVLQVSRGITDWKLPGMTTTSQTTREASVTLVTAEQQLKNLHPATTEELIKIKEQIVTEMRNFGPSGWLVPVAGALIGGLLAYWVLRAFVVIWLGFIGAAMVVLGGSAVLCANWPSMRESLIAQPQICAAVALGLWLMGLLIQAKEARFPKRKPAEKPKEAA
jgi:hypothetical protein